MPAVYWMQLHPVRLTGLAVLGYFFISLVPLIIHYLKKLATFLWQRSAWATQIMDLLFERVRWNVAPVEEFQWLRLMLFVAVPFPGTGAWTGTIISSVHGMPFWSGLSANFVGVVLAGLLINLLMNLGLKYTTGSGVLLFIVSTIVWGALRGTKKSLN
uniref:Small multi-drug export protein n=1 Tax=Triticum urartu TaxID=4572 RepID=A0A8R7V9Z0_TRIUA